MNTMTSKSAPQPEKPRPFLKLYLFNSYSTAFPQLLSVVSTARASTVRRDLLTSPMTLEEEQYKTWFMQPMPPSEIELPKTAVYTESSEAKIWITLNTELKLIVKIAKKDFQGFSGVGGGKRGENQGSELEGFNKSIKVDLRLGQHKKYKLMTEKNPRWDPVCKLFDDVLYFCMNEVGTSDCFLMKLPLKKFKESLDTTSLEKGAEVVLKGYINSLATTKKCLWCVQLSSGEAYDGSKVITNTWTEKLKGEKISFFRLPRHLGPSSGSNMA